nr:MAG TPA: hypothetical protein [Caudoviricetes sp.]
MIMINSLLLKLKGYIYYIVFKVKWYLGTY